MSNSASPWTTACQASLSITNSQRLLKFMTLSQWCHPSISSSIILFSSCFQSFPASWSFPVATFASGGQSFGASALAISPSNEYSGLISLGLTGLISLQSKGLSRLFQHCSSKASVLWCSVFFMVQLLHPYMTTGKTILTFWGSLSPGQDQVLKQQTAYLSSVPKEQKLLPKLFQGFWHYWILYLPYWIL